MGKTSGCFGPGEFLDARGYWLDIGLPVTTSTSQRGVVKSFDSNTKTVRVALTTDSGQTMADYTPSDLMIVR